MIDASALQVLLMVLTGWLARRELEQKKTGASAASWAPGAYA